MIIHLVDELQEISAHPIIEMAFAGLWDLGNNLPLPDQPISDKVYVDILKIIALQFEFEEACKVPNKLCSAQALRYCPMQDNTQASVLVNQARSHV